MLSRSIRKSLLDIKIPTSTLPPAFLLSNRARCFNSTAQHVESPITGSASQLSPKASTTSSEIGQSSSTSDSSNAQVPSSPIAASITSSVRELLPLLAAQPSHFITAHIHARPYLLTTGDTIRLPFHMPGVVPGDVLRLNRASAIGSRDYTLKGTPYVDERLFECRARVLGTESEPMRIKTKTKRRNRKIKTVKNKLRFTILRVAELKINQLEEIEG